MRRTIVIGLFSLISVCSFSQELQVQDVIQNSIVEDNSIVKDINGNPCALVKVFLSQKGIEFENTYIVDVVSKDTVYWVYMAQGAKRLRIKHPDYLPKDIVFADYGINTLASGNIYKIRINEDIPISVNIDNVDRTFIDNIYKQKWNYHGEKLSAVNKMIIYREALGGKKEAQIAMANICLFEKEYDLAVQWVKNIIEEGDTMCLKEMGGELLYQYAIRIPQPQSYSKDSHDYTYLLGYIVGQLSLKDEYDKAYQLTLNAYNKGYVGALEKSKEYKSLSNEISLDSLFLLMKNDRMLNISSIRLGFPKAPALYLILRELSKRGNESARRQFELYNEYLGLNED